MAMPVKGGGDCYKEIIKRMEHFNSHFFGGGIFSVESGGVFIWSI